LYLNSLTAIIVSRLALGVMEAVLFTISTAMIGDYYEGRQRERYMSLQTTVASFSAFLFNTLGGVIAEYGWRAPYFVFSISLVLAPLMMIFLWEPKTRASMTQEQIAQDSQAFNARLLGFICSLAVLMGVVFLTVPVHFGYLHGEIGVKSPAQIGEAFGINSLGVIVGTLIFGWIVAPRLSVAFQLALSALVAGLGFYMMELASSYAELTAAGFINGLGCGLLLPTLVTWNMRELPISKRGMGVGAYQSCMFLGMFLNPILIVWVEKNMVGSRTLAVGFEGRVLLVLGLIALVVGLFSSKRRV
jgi:MFS family permease